MESKKAEIVYWSDLIKANVKEEPQDAGQSFDENENGQPCLGEFVEMPPANSFNIKVKFEPGVEEPEQAEKNHLDSNANDSARMEFMQALNLSNILKQRTEENPSNGQASMGDFIKMKPKVNIKLKPETIEVSDLVNPEVAKDIDNETGLTISPIQNPSLTKHPTPIQNLATSILHKNITESVSTSMIHAYSSDAAAAAAVVSNSTTDRVIPSSSSSQRRKPDYFMCMTCGEGTPNAEILKNHNCISKYTAVPNGVGLQRPPEPPRTYACQLCDKAFSHYSSLKRHENVHKNQFASMIQAEAQITLSAIPNKPAPSRKRRASNSNNIGLFACSHCPSSFHTASKLGKHESTHLREKKHICPICSIEFPSSLSFKFHVEKTHGVGFNGEISASFSGASAAFPNGNGRNGEFLEWAQTQVGLGQESGRRKMPFWQAQGTSSGSTSESGQDGLSRDADMSTDQGVSPPGSPDNPHSPLNVEAFMAPQVEIKEEPAWTCETCHTKFSDYTQLQSHNSAFCGLIPASDIPKPNLHMCHICPEIFRTHYDLMKHLSVHSSLKPFQCPECPSKFARLQCLTRHSRVHAGAHPEQKGPNSFVCPYCKEDYPQQAILTKHMLIHTGERPYECSFCQARFRLTSHLNRHVLLHTGQKSFACRFCPEKFTQSISLQCHERKHTGERPFGCRYCPSRFRLSAHCKRHEQAHEAKGEAEILLSLKEEMMKEENLSANAKIEQSSLPLE